MPKVSKGFYVVLRSACQTTADLHQTEIGTDCLLISLAQAFPRISGVLLLNAVVKADPRPAKRRVTMRVELPPEAEVELMRAVREAHWRTFGWSEPSAPPRPPPWEEDAAVAIRTAMAIAVARGAPWVGADHLLEALLDDSNNLASLLVRRRNVDLELLTEEARLTWPVGGGEPPFWELADVLRRVGVLSSPAQKKKYAVRGHLFTRITKRYTDASPALYLLELEAIAETVRLGHDRTSLIHLVLAVLVLEEQMAATGLQPTAQYLPSGGFILRSFGLERELVQTAVPLPARVGAIAPPQRRRVWRNSSKNPPWTPAAARAAEAARELERTSGRIPGGSAHLLYAVLADADNAGRQLLRDHLVSPDAVQDLIAERLGISRRA